MTDSPKFPPFLDPEVMKAFTAQMDGGGLPDGADPMTGYKHAMDAWGQVLEPLAKAGRSKVDPADRRFKGEQWDHPVFDLMRQGYSVMSEYMTQAAQQVAGIDDAQKAKLNFAVKQVVDAMSPANNAFTNPMALEKAIETKGASLMKGMAHMMADLQRGQMTHTDPAAFRLGENIAATPGKVVHETPLYQLVQYAPTTDKVLKTPLVIFPPWINRFYILDLTAEKSFIKWCADQGITVFIASWKSADSSMKNVVWDDYIAAEIDAIDTIRDLLDVKSVHAIGYCVAGTTLAAALAVLAAKGEAAKVKSATFFTAQVDFSEAGELLSFIDDHQLKMIEALSGEGYLDGRFLALTFNLLRGNDLIWSTVVKNYLLGDDYPAFDLLHWNGDVTNLPARWHKDYLCDLYRDNMLVEPGRLSALGVPIDLSKVETPSYIQAGREDHIAPAKSVWKIRDHFKGPLKFVLAGSGHIAGVVNPPVLQKYQYWLNNDPQVNTLEAFIEGATEIKGSWWPDWIEWLQTHGDKMVKAEGARIPGEGKLKAIEDAPGRYVKSR
ncbi:PHA/PHB synthase family protein [Sphingorhabdus arenilitoris]|uniref:PHA/PHB synthase family protein n=1 Tax=Sphingorhabdus arenilitoris TaxID=1490041 RepID=A0ABV8RCS3_9SPHN